MCRIIYKKILQTGRPFGILFLEKAIPLIYFAEMARKFLRDRRSAPLWVFRDSPSAGRGRFFFPCKPGACLGMKGKPAGP